MSYNIYTNLVKLKYSTKSTGFHGVQEGREDKETHREQRAGPHPGLWHTAPADAQSLNVERKRTDSTTFSCHDC